MIDFAGSTDPKPARSKTNLANSPTSRPPRQKPGPAMPIFTTESQAFAYVEKTWPEEFTGLDARLAGATVFGFQDTMHSLPLANRVPFVKSLLPVLTGHADRQCARTQAEAYLEVARAILVEVGGTEGEPEVVG